MLPDSLQTHNQVEHGSYMCLINLDLAPLVRECANKKALDAQMKAMSHFELEDALEQIERPLTEVEAERSEIEPS